MGLNSNNGKTSYGRFLISSCFCVIAIVLPFQALQAQSTGETAVIELNRPEPQNSPQQNNLPQQNNTQNSEQPNSGAAQNNTATDSTSTGSTGSIQNNAAGTDPFKPTAEPSGQVKQDSPENGTGENGTGKAEQTGTINQPQGQQQGASTEQNKPNQNPKAQSSEKQTTTQKSGTEPSGSEKVLTLVSWGGAYAAAQDVTFLAPFSEAEKFKTKLDQHDQKIETIKTRIASPDSGWDVLDLSQGLLEQACSAGLLETIDPSILSAGPNGPAQTDFLEGSLKTCGVGTMAWSSTLIYNTRVFTKKKLPQTAKDFFNLKTFKGQRALPKQPEYILELALLADGAAPSEVYSLLETEAGIERAFKRLDTIKKNISWTTDPTEPLNLVKEGKAALGVAYTGQIFSAITKDQSPLAMIWDSQIYNINYLAVPKTSKNRDQALKFISFATTPERLARQASWFPYGPVRKSSIALIGKHPEAGIEVSRYVPTQDARMKTALHHNQIWWQTHREDLQDRFQKWLNGEPYLKKPEVTQVPEQQNNAAQNGTQQNNTTSQTTQGAKPQ